MSMLQENLDRKDGRTSVIAGPAHHDRHKTSSATPALVQDGRDERLMAMDALVANPHFRASERNKQFLKFVVEETVAGRADRIKAFTIAIDVFNRDVDFDASVDPIVRIAAGQLRKSLHNYYSGAGRHDAIRISLPLGAYIPFFEKRRSWTVRALMGIRRPGRAWRWPALAACLLLSAAIGTAFLFEMPGTGVGPQTDKPTVIIDAVRSSSGDTQATIAGLNLADSLRVTVGRYTAIRVVAVQQGEELADVAARSDDSFGKGQQLFQLLSSVQIENDRLRVYWHLVDARTGETYFSDIASESFDAEGPGLVVDKVAARITASLFAPEGALANRVNYMRIAENSH